MDEDYISHHGVKGMKWGVRRTPEQLGHKQAKKKKSFGDFIRDKKRQEASAKQKSNSDQKKLSEMTDEEIRRKIARFELESEYRRMVESVSAKKKSSAQRFVSKIGQQSVNSFQKSIGDKIGKKAANLVWNSLFGDSNDKKDKKDD